MLTSFVRCMMTTLVFFSGILGCFQPIPFIGGRPGSMKAEAKRQSNAGDIEIQQLT